VPEETLKANFDAQNFPSGLVRHKHYENVEADAVEVIVPEIFTFCRGERIVGSDRRASFPAKGEENADLRPPQNAPLPIVFRVYVVVLKVPVERGTESEANIGHYPVLVNRQKILPAERKAVGIHVVEVVRCYGPGSVDK